MAAETYGGPAIDVFLFEMIFWLKFTGEFTVKCDARSSNGTPLFNSPCRQCGASRLVDKRRVGGVCAKCSIPLRNGVHGQSKTRLYKIWSGMKARCQIPSAQHYEYYGGRGIQVCSEWFSYLQFSYWAKSSGYIDGLEIDRLDNNGHYEPGNCRFVTHQINSQKRSNSKCNLAIARQIKHLLGEGNAIDQVSIKLNVPYMVIWHISKGNTWRNA